MKELTIEEKAKRYDEVLIRVSRLWESDMMTRESYEYIFPELVEFKDESIRKELIDYFSCSHSTDSFRGIPWDKVISWLEKQGGQKPVDKVEPKFKVGDWVAINPELRFASPLCIRDNDNNNYRVESVDGNSGTPTIDYLNNHYHLWDITKDAKYGDMLADDYGIYIFDRFDEYDKKCFLCAGAYQYSQKVYEDERMLCSIDVRPATKVQRDTLIKAMEDAGYTFDFDKKELKKIEQKPTDIYPIFRVNDCIRNKRTGDKVLIEQLDIKSKMYCYFSNDGAAEVHSDFSFSEQNDWELIGQNIVEQKPSWSEEDEYYYGIVQYILNNERVGKADKENASNWFKSIKDRVQPQPKQEWNEEDEKNLEKAIWYIEKGGKLIFEKTDKLVSWLKSLRPQNTWKPSDEYYELEEFAKIVRGNLTGISKAVQELFEAKYLQLTGNKMYGGFKD